MRSGIGVSDDSVIFAISEQPVNFYEFATFFRDVLNCSSALYLDGVISRMYLPDLGKTDTNGDLLEYLLSLMIFPPNNGTDFPKACPNL